MGRDQALVVTGWWQDQHDMDTALRADRRGHGDALFGTFPDDRLEGANPGLHLDQDGVEAAIEPHVARPAARTGDR